MSEGFYDERTFSIQYVAACPETKRCAIIDPVLDFDEKSGETATRSADTILAYVADQGLAVDWILDTHPHADHFSAAAYLKAKTGAPTAIGAHIVDVQTLWKQIYLLPDLACDGSQWDKLFVEGRDVPGRRDRLPHSVFTGPHARVDQLSDRRRGLRARHFVHAGQRHGARGFPRWQRGPAL